MILENRRRIWKQNRLSASQALAAKRRGVVSKVVGQSACPTRLLQAGGPGDLTRSVQASCRNTAGQPSNCSGSRYTTRQLMTRTGNKNSSGVDLKHGSYHRYLARKTGGVLRQEQMPHIRNRTARIGQPRNRTGTSACVNPCGGVETTPQCGGLVLETGSFILSQEHGGIPLTSGMKGYSVGFSVPPPGVTSMSVAGACVAGCPPVMCGGQLLMLASMSPSLGTILGGYIIVGTNVALSNTCWKTITIISETGGQATLHSGIPTTSITGCVTGDGTPIPVANVWLFPVGVFSSFLESLSGGSRFQVVIDDGSGGGSCCSTACCDNRIPSMEDITKVEEDPGRRTTTTITTTTTPGSTEISVSKANAFVGVVYSTEDRIEHIVSVDGGTTWSAPLLLDESLGQVVGEYNSLSVGQTLIGGDSFYVSYTVGPMIGMTNEIHVSTVVGGTVVRNVRLDGGAVGDGRYNTIVSVRAATGLDTVYVAYVGGASGSAAVTIQRSVDSASTFTSRPGPGDAKSAALAVIPNPVSPGTDDMLLVPFYENTTSAETLKLAYSSDNGSTWSTLDVQTRPFSFGATIPKPSIVASGNGVGVAFHLPTTHPSVTFPAGDLFFAKLRFNASGTLVVQSVQTIESGDGIREVGIYNSLALKDGKIYVSYSSALAPTPLFTSLKLAVSADGGSTWSRYTIATGLVGPNAITTGLSQVAVAFSKHGAGQISRLSFSRENSPVTSCRATGALGNNTQCVSSTRCNKCCSHGDAVPTAPSQNVPALAVGLGGAPANTINIPSGGAIASIAGLPAVISAGGTAPSNTVNIPSGGGAIASIPEGGTAPSSAPEGEELSLGGEIVITIDPSPVAPEGTVELAEEASVTILEHGPVAQ